MSLYKSVLETVHQDLCRLETTLINNILHGTGEQTTGHKAIGKAAGTQWSRVFLAAISKWCSDNASASKAPETFLPDFNDAIKAIMHPESLEENDSSEDSVD
jgi:hypothetical protein